MKIASQKCGAFLFCEIVYICGVGENCPSCGNGKQKMGVCEVHSLVDGDYSEYLVKHCWICDAWICDVCKSNKSKRIKAAVICKANKVLKFIHEII